MSPQVADRWTVQDLAANTIDVRVVAIAKDVGLLSKWNVYVPNQTLRDLYQLRSDATGAIHIHFAEKDLAFLPRMVHLGAPTRYS